MCYVEKDVLSSRIDIAPWLIHQLYGAYTMVQHADLNVVPL